MIERRLGIIIVKLCRITRIVRRIEDTAQLLLLGENIVGEDGRDKKWCKDPPTENGYYWYNDYIGTDIVRVTGCGNDKGDVLKIWFVGDPDFYTIEQLHGQWYGPLKRPIAKGDV